MKKQLIIIALFILGSELKAQQFPGINHVFINNNLTNPSLSGLDDKVNLMLVQRNTLVGFSQNPKTLYLNVTGPVVTDKIGVGLNLYSESLGITKKTGVYGSYAYRLKFGEDHNLNLGVSLGVLQFSIDPNAVDVTNAEDPVLINKNFNASAMDGMFGATYIKSNFRLGLAVAQVLGNKEKLSNTVNYNLQRNYQATIQYKLYLDELQHYSITPLIVARYAKSAMPQEVHFVFNMRDKFYLVPAYKSSGSASITTSAVVYNKFRIGYSYEAMLKTPVKGNQRGGHEVLFGYAFDIFSKAFEKQQKQINELAEKMGAFENMQKTRDSLQDAAIEKLQQGLQQDSLKIAENSSKINSNKARIDKTEKELKALKNKLIEEGIIREFDASEYEGNPAKGYYMVIASVKNKNYNPQAMQDEYLSKGYYKVYNKKRGWHYVYTVRLDDFSEALDLLKTTRKTIRKDAWIHIMK